LNRCSKYLGMNARFVSELVPVFASEWMTDLALNMKKKKEMKRKKGEKKER